ncbi:hypothetical protein [Companilactobacillus ginsenosidimutans]|uniref:Uncharacterized protein n=1 Tax=Companilactobacillus ginsenosidimutans TaxID=1007676 RepID=A0A0H4QFK0_9LACO|nr:hypothetical protein [Companilactobacillus ginsenosidimutans]AKP67189.1 hypothetical protein ABM34_06335 [Companilactobacillus ginsenosidimutans]
MSKTKVIIWGLGNVGRSAVRMLAERKNLFDLVAAVDVDPNKIGKDAGEVFDFDPVGVKVTDDIDAALKLDADMVLDFCPTEMDKKGTFMPSAIRLAKSLDAGKNVITTIPVYHCQDSQPEVYEFLNEHAKANNVAFVPFGLLPGDYASYMPLVIAGAMGRVDQISVQSGEDDWHNTSGWVDVFQYGADIDKYPKPDSDEDLLAKFIYAYYSSGVYEMADRIGLKYDEFKPQHEVFTAPMDLETIKGTVKKGTIYGHRFTMALYDNGKEVAALRYVHKVCHKKTPELPINNTIHLEGLPGPVNAEIDGLIPEREGYVTSAAPAVNLINSVMDAGKVGYVEACDLPVAIPAKLDKDQVKI